MVRAAHGTVDWTLLTCIVYDDIGRPHSLQINRNSIKHLDRRLAIFVVERPVSELEAQHGRDIMAFWQQI